MWALLGAESDLNTIPHTMNMRRTTGGVGDVMESAGKKKELGRRDRRDYTGNREMSFKLRQGMTVFVGLGWDVNVPFRVPGRGYDSCDDDCEGGAGTGGLSAAVRNGRSENARMRGEGGGVDQKDGCVHEYGHGNGHDGNAYEHERGHGHERDEEEVAEHPHPHQHEANHQSEEQQREAQEEGGEGRELCKVGVAVLWCVLDGDDGITDDEEDG